MSKRRNTLTRFIEDIVDDSKDFVDDILDRAKDVENDMHDAVTDVFEDDDEPTGYGSGLNGVQAALEDLTAKVNQLAELQLAAAKK
jgi:hypothetical protein